MEREFLLTYKDIDMITGSGKQKHLLIEQKISRLFLCVSKECFTQNKLIVLNKGVVRRNKGQEVLYLTRSVSILGA